MKSWIAVSALALMLSSCATIPSGPVMSETQKQQAHAMQQENAAAWFAAHPSWNMAGRIAVSAPNNSGSGRLDWTNLRDGYVAEISAPITRQTWRLTYTGADGAVIEGLSGGERRGSDAEQLLFEVSGWRIPLNELRAWMQGITPADVTVLRDPVTGLPQQFTQGEWQVRYEEWTVADAATGVPVLPKRITATVGETTKVKLVIDSWSGE